MTDFIIVGQGLAASVLMHSFHQAKISFKVVGNDELSSCSKVAAGIWNPIVFKRLPKSWLAGEVVPCLNYFYSSCEST
jgi:glycine oxidase